MYKFKFKLKSKFKLKCKFNVAQRCTEGAQSYAEANENSNLNENGGRSPFRVGVSGAMKMKMEIKKGMGFNIEFY